jgi:hypothetical protein
MVPFEVARRERLRIAIREMSGFAEFCVFKVLKSLRA